MNILGKKVTLRAIEQEDLEKLWVWANNTETQDIMGDIHFPSSKVFHKNWFDRLQNDPLNQRFAIDAGEGILGISSIIQIDWRNRHGHHGMFLGDKNIRGKGFGTDTVMATMRYAFDELGFERLNGSFIEYNRRSQDFYSKLGWKEEGVRRNYYYRRGRFWNMIPTGVTKQDYYRLVLENNYWGDNEEL